MDSPIGRGHREHGPGQFVECGGGSNVITHVAIGTEASGAGLVLYAGALTAPRTVSSGIQPQFAAGSLTVTES